ncbi:MAG: prolyl-tRNA synthetase associated domain-containing protein [Clostridiales bacterium]|nr:prolyl-tRNA synthetase associated domain-containing protein [Clostridiales bacterium]
MSTKEFIMAQIRALDIPHEYHEHEAAYTMEDCLALPYAAPDVTFCKNILLCNRQQTAFFLYVTLPDKPFRTADVSKRLNSSRLSFAPADCLPQMLHLESGSLSPLGLWFDADKRIRLAFDREVQQAGRIAFHPCDNTATVLFRQEDFWQRVVPALGHEALFI